MLIFVLTALVLSAIGGTFVWLRSRNSGRAVRRRGSRGAPQARRIDPGRTQIQRVESRDAAAAVAKPSQRAASSAPPESATAGVKMIVEPWRAYRSKTATPPNRQALSPTGPRRIQVAVPKPAGSGLSFRESAPGATETIETGPHVIVRPVRAGIAASSKGNALDETATKVAATPPDAPVAASLSMESHPRQTDRMPPSTTAASEPAVSLSPPSASVIVAAELSRAEPIRAATAAPTLAQSPPLSAPAIAPTVPPAAARASSALPGESAVAAPHADALPQAASNDDEAAGDGRAQTPPVVWMTPSTTPCPEPKPVRSRHRVDLPPLDLLATMSDAFEVQSPESLEETGKLIEQRLREFKVPVTVLGASAGPVITRFEVEPAVGVRGNQIVALMKDLARGLGRTSIRVVETIPGKTCMGLELPNERRQMIGLADILRSDAYTRHDSPLALAMGKDITGEPVVTDLGRAPHMLVAGTTGSGKSVAVNAMILSMLYKATPDEVRMIMIDPKMLELSVYDGIPHLLAPVVTDMKLAANALNWCVVEMEDRYRLMSELRVRNIAGYNQKILAARAAGKPLQNPFPAHVETPELLDTLPLIVVLIDELADLMMVAGKKIEELIARLAQKARAAGIHLILATQRPSVDVITGLIKANIPTRVAFQVSSKIDSRTILDQMGAESLLGAGDMLFLPPGTGYPQRVHGAFVADEEVHRVVAYLKQFGEPDYRTDILAAAPGETEPTDLFGDAGDAELDPLYDEAVACVLRSRRASISSVQRQLRIGYNRAARLVESMEAAGLVSAVSRNGTREVLAPGGSDAL